MKSASFLLRWRPLLLILLILTGLIGLIGGLVNAGVGSLLANPDYSDLELRVIALFLWVALLVGVMLPLIAWLAWIRHAQPRHLLGLYLLVLIVQIATEQVANELFPSSIVVVIGTVYTLLRLGQLLQSQRSLRGAESGRSGWLLRLLQLLLVFWSSNLLMLLVVSWPSVWP